MILELPVIPAYAGIYIDIKMDSRFHGNDELVFNKIKSRLKSALRILLNCRLPIAYCRLVFVHPEGFEPSTL